MNRMCDRCAICPNRMCDRCVILPNRMCDRCVILPNRMCNRCVILPNRMCDRCTIDLTECGIGIWRACVNTSNECPYLSKYFKIITNYSGKELQIITDMLRESDVQFIDIDMDKEPNNTNVCNAKLYTSDDRFLPYNKSIFFRIEKALLVKDFSTENNQLEIRTVTKEEIDRLFDDPILPELSVEMLNIAASKNGQLMKFYTLEGLNICVDSIDFTKDKSPRNIAKVENAFNELVKNSYIEPIGSKGEIFNVTEKGYEYLVSA